jgi:hypothetical protein
MYKAALLSISLFSIPFVCFAQEAPGIKNDGSQPIVLTPDELKNARSAMPTLTAPPSAYENTVQPDIPVQSGSEAGSLPRVIPNTKAKQQPDPVENIQHIQ